MSLTINGLENSLQKLTTFPISCRHNFTTIGPLILMKMGVASERSDERTGFECCSTELEAGISMALRVQKLHGRQPRRGSLSYSCPSGEEMD